MTLREEFENEIKTNKSGISVLFETSNQHYIEWLECKVKNLSSNAVLSDRLQIHVSEIKQLKNRLREINDNEIMNIDFLDDNGLLIKIDEKKIADWKFTGLNITDFIESDFYITGFTDTDILR